jgi:hypothetical protein
MQDSRIPAVSAVYFVEVRVKIVWIRSPDQSRYLHSQRSKLHARLTLEQGFKIESSHYAVATLGYVTLRFHVKALHTSKD